MSGLADQLAREAVALSLDQGREALIEQVAAAIREALTEAAKVARKHKAQHVRQDTPHYQDGDEIADAIELLK